MKKPSTRTVSSGPILRHDTALRFAEVHSGLSALVADQASDPVTSRQFDGLWLSSLTGTASYGMPDLEMSLVDGRMSVLEQVTRVTSKPIIVDGGTGGDETTVRFLCETLQRFGVQILVLEDKAFPKRNSLVGSDQELLSADEFCEKIWAAKDAAQEPDFQVVARLESLISGMGMEDALARAIAYRKAGADGLLIHSRSPSQAEVIEFANRFRQIHPDVPLICVPTTYHGATARELFVNGFQGVIYANHLLRAAHAAMEDVCHAILRHDGTGSVEARISPVKTIFQVTGYTKEMARLAERSQARASISAEAAQ